MKIDANMTSFGKPGGGPTNQLFAPRTSVGVSLGPKGTLERPRGGPDTALGANTSQNGAQNAPTMIQKRPKRSQIKKNITSKNNVKMHQNTHKHTHTHTHSQEDSIDPANKFHH